MKTVYVAGPLTKSDDKTLWQCVRDAVKVADDLKASGLAPIVPHLTVLWAMMTDDAAISDYEEWMEIDFAIMKQCDAVFRLPGHSRGADREVALAKDHGIPVFVTLGEICSWAELQKPEGESAFSGAYSSYREIQKNLLSVADDRNAWRLRALKSHNENEALKAEIEELREAAVGRSESSEALKTMNLHQASTIRNLRDDNISLMQDNRALFVNNEDLIKLVKDLQEERDKLEQENANLEDETSQLQADCDSYMDVMRELSEECARLRDRMGNTDIMLSEHLEKLRASVNWCRDGWMLQQHTVGVSNHVMTQATICRVKVSKND